MNQSQTNGKKVRQLRTARNLSLRVLAAMIHDRTGEGVSPQALEQVESGKNDLSLKKTAALAACLGVGVSDITIGCAGAAHGEQAMTYLPCSCRTLRATDSAPEEIIPCPYHERLSPCVYCGDELEMYGEDVVDLPQGLAHVECHEKAKGEAS